MQLHLKWTHLRTLDCRVAAAPRSDNVRASRPAEQGLLFSPFQACQAYATTPPAIIASEARRSSLSPPITSATRKSRISYARPPASAAGALVIACRTAIAAKPLVNESGAWPEGGPVLLC